MRISRMLFSACVLVALSALEVAAAQQPLPVPAPAAGPRVALHTNQGDIVIELAPDRAPATVANFLEYVHDGFYNGTLFHRVIDNLLIQGGAYTIDLQPKPSRAPIALESNNGLSNLRGTVAAARTPSKAESATSQFFINVVDNPRLDFSGDTSDFTKGFAVFGKVVSGMDVVDRIRLVETQAKDPLPRDVPVEPIVIESAEELSAAAR